MHPEPTSSRRSWPIREIVTAMAVIVPLCGLVYEAYWRATNAEIYLVGALPQKYTVELDGRTFELEPHEPRLVTLPRRALAVVAQFPARKESFEIELGLESLGEIFSRKTRVLNPDRLAFLGREEKVYTPDPKDGSLSVDWYFGERLYRFEKVDFVFEEFPELELRRKRLVRDRIFVLPLSLVSLVAYLRAEGGSPAAEKALELYAAVDPENQEARLQMLEGLPAERFAVLAASELEKSPPDIDWHRAYQSLPDQAGREEELVRTYRGWLARHPEDSGWLYLLARIVVDAREAGELTQRAVKAQNASPWAWHGLAWRELAAGRFAAAGEANRRSLDLEPDNDDFASTKADLLAAAGDYESALEKTDFYDLEQRLAMLANLKRADEAGDVIASALVADPIPRDQVERVQFYRTFLCYPEGLSCFEQQLPGQKHPGAKLWLGLLRRDPALVEAGKDWEDPLVESLWAAAVLPAGQSYRARAAELLEEEGFEGALAARALRGETFSREDLLAMRYPLREKALVLLLVGRETKDREMLELAAKLNVHPDLGQLLLKRELGV